MSIQAMAPLQSSSMTDDDYDDRPGSLRRQLHHHGRGGTASGRQLAARCAALYVVCLHASAQAVGGVSTMPLHEHGGRRAAHAASALRRFPEMCEGLFKEGKIASPLEKVSREVEEKLGVSSEIVRLSR